MDRLLIEKIEGRILVGIVMFVSIMILIGWVAINEEARMASFVEIFEGRNIERGAELFAANCSTCHGTDGRGLLGVAPGLNSPHYFGFDPFSEVVNDIEWAQIRIDELTMEREELIAEIGTGADAERVTEIQSRIEEIDMLLDPSVESLSEDMVAELEAELADADEERAAQIEFLLAVAEDGTPASQIISLREERDALVASLEDAYISGYLPGMQALFENTELSPEELDAEFATLVQENGTRMNQVGWAGTVDAYTTTTLIHGRPGSGDIWPQAMASFSQQTGAALRDDELQYLVSYIRNWDLGDGWTTDHLLAVNQYGKRKMERIDLSTVSGESVPPAGTDVAVILTELEGLEGDPARGEAIYTSAERASVAPPAALGCSGCHAGGAAAPATEEQWRLVNEERLAEPQFADYTAEQYIVESIVNPGAYVVDGYAAGAMPATFGNQMSVQDIADVIAYVRSYSE